MGSQLENTDLQQPAPHAGWKFSTDAVILWEWGMCAGWGGLEFLPVCPAMGWCSGKLRHGSMGSWERGSAGGQQEHGAHSRSSGAPLQLEQQLGWGLTLAPLVQHSQPQWGPEQWGEPHPNVF